MVALVRGLAFGFSALGLEVFRGPGAAVLVLSAILGGLRASPLLAVGVAGAGAALSLALPEAAGGAGKVSHALSNAAFVVVLYVVLAVGGYLGGRLARAAVSA